MRRLKNNCALVLVTALILTGCDFSELTVSENVISYNSVSENSISENEVTNSVNFIINKSGFEKNAPKGILVEGETLGDEYSIVDTITGEEVYKDTLYGVSFNAVTGKITGLCKFSNLANEGTFVVNIGDISSEEFEISDGLYRNILMQRLNYYSESNTTPKGFSSATLGKSIMRISDLLLSWQIFGDVIAASGAENKENDGNAEIPGSEEAIPQTIQIAKQEIDVLKDCVDSKGVIKNLIEDETKRQYQLSAVMALFSEEYSKYDKAAAREYLNLAEKAFEYAQEKYSQEDSNAYDARLYGAASLFHVTGRSNYSKIVEQYAGNLPKGFNEDNCGYLGIIAYLTSHYRVNTTISKDMMSLLMNDAIEISVESAKDSYLVCNNGAYNNETIMNAFSDARLLVLANYISMNIEYIEACENCLEFLYGRNPEAVDYAYEIGSRYYNEPQTFILSGLMSSYIGTN